MIGAGIVTKFLANQLLAHKVVYERMIRTHLFHPVAVFKVPGYMLHSPTKALGSFTHLIRVGRELVTIVAKPAPSRLWVFKQEMPRDYVVDPLVELVGSKARLTLEKLVEFAIEYTILGAIGTFGVI